MGNGESRPAMKLPVPPHKIMSKMFLPIKYRLYEGFLWVKSDGEIWTKVRPSKAKVVTPVTQWFGVDFIYNGERQDWKGRWFYKEIIGNLQGHNGIDLETPNRTCLYAPEEGIITKTSITGGKSVYLTSKKYKHAFFHLQDILVALGQKVKQGQLIALTDNTGLYTTAPHLHWGVRPLNCDLQNGFNGYINQKDFVKSWDIHYWEEVYKQIDEYRIKTGIIFNDPKEWEKIQKKFKTKITCRDFFEYLSIKN
jgi:murein DD-endopeptidase MepM/ murein hydrolase activator NlpD